MTHPDFNLSQPETNDSAHALSKSVWTKPVLKILGGQAAQTKAIIDPFEDTVRFTRQRGGTQFTRFYGS